MIIFRRSKSAVSSSDLPKAESLIQKNTLKQNLFSSLKKKLGQQYKRRWKNHLNLHSQAIKKRLSILIQDFDTKNKSEDDEKENKRFQEKKKKKKKYVRQLFLTNLAKHY